MMKRDSFISSTIKYSISSWINLLLGVAFVIVSTRVLEPSAYGKLNIFTNSANTLMYIVILGQDASYMRFYHETPHGEKRNLFVFKLMLFSILVLIILFIGTSFLCHEWISEKMFGEISWLLTILLFMMVFTNLILRYLNITYRMAYNTRMYNIQNILVQSSTKLLIILGAFIKPTHYTVIFVQTIGFIILTLTYVIIQRKDILPYSNITQHELLDFAGYKTIFTYGFFCAPVYIITNLNVLVILQIIRDKISDSAVGIYSSVNLFSSLFTALQTGFSTFWAAYIYENYNDNKQKITEMTNYICLAGIAIFSGFVIFRRVIYLFIGEPYHESIRFFSLLIAPKILGFVSQATIYGINISKKTYIDAFFIGAYCVTNIGLSYMFVKSGGVIGIAYVGLIAYFIYFILDTIFGQKYYRTIIDVKKFVWTLVAIIAIAIIPTLSSRDILITLSTLSIMIFSICIYKNEVAAFLIKAKTKVIKTKELKRYDN